MAKNLRLSISAEALKLIAASSSFFFDIYSALLDDYAAAAELMYFFERVTRAPLWRESTRTTRLLLRWPTTFDSYSFKVISVACREKEYKIK